MGLSFAQHDHQPVSLFRELCDQYANFASVEGVEVRTYADPSLPLFSKLSLLEQNRANEFLARSIEVFSELQKEGLSLRNNSRLLWRIIRKLGLTPESDVFDKVASEDTIEIYSLDHRHLFWNLQLMETISFTLEQMFSHPWYELASRPPEILQKFMTIAENIISGKLRGTISIDVPTHTIQEINSARLFKIEAKVKFMSTLCRNGELAGAITVAKARIVGSSLTSTSR